MILGEVVDVMSVPYQRYDKPIWLVDVAVDVMGHVDYMCLYCTSKGFAETIKVGVKVRLDCVEVCDKEN